MLSKFRSFVFRHKKKFIAGTIVIAGTCALRYAQKKFLDYQEKVNIFINIL